MTDRLAEERQLLARCCRLMAYRGLVENVLGHISLRIDTDRALVRCRGPQEAGLRFTQPDDIVAIDLDTDAPLERSDTHRPPAELPIHTEILRGRPDVASVVHVHPPAVVIAALAELPLEPIFGAYDIPALRLAERGIPRYDRSVLINTCALGREITDHLGQADALILTGHGLVTVGPSPASAMLTALAVDTLARITTGVRAAGADPEPIPEDDRQQLPDLGSGFNTDTLWRHHLACLAADGWDLPT